MPVYSSHLLSYKSLRLGHRFRDARVQRGLTLRELASKISASTARLSEIENELHPLDLAEVALLAGALELPLDHFLPPDVPIPYQICRDRTHHDAAWCTVELHGPAGSHSRYPNEFLPLAELFVGRHMEPVLSRVMPVPDDQLQLCYHHEQEFVFVLKGSIEFLMETPNGPVRETLQRGDCVYFRSDLPHAVRSGTATAAETLHLFSSPSSPSDPGLLWLAHVGSSAPLDLSGQAGDRLRLLREMRGWTVEQVAAFSGVPLRRLQNIEQGHRSAPIETLLTLARLFGKPLGELVGHSAEPGSYYSIQRSAQIAQVADRRRRTPVERPDAPKSKTCQPLAGRFPTHGMYPYFLRMLNVEMDTLTLHAHHGEEFLYVLEGDLELITYAGSQRVTEALRPGDSCYIDSSVPHLLHSSTRNPYGETSAAVLDVFWCPLGEDYLFDLGN
ncbi:MAG: helix-turn-helix domain-containing protein [Vicinamibacterales bacterium]